MKSEIILSFQRLVKKGFWHVLIQTHRILGIKQKFTIGNITILLTPDHKLRYYTKIYPEFDKFLITLAKFLPSENVVIDVGANIGDTLAMMIGSNPNLEFICIDGDPLYFEYLTKNVKKIRANLPAAKIECINSIIGNTSEKISLIRGKGTAYQIENSFSSKNKRTLDSILSNHLASPIALLKIDTDGFDYDVIRSALKTIQKQKPLIYFELQHSNSSQIREYQSVIQELFAFGYLNFAIFDNFGGYLFTTSSINNIFELMTYVQRQYISATNRTIYHFDILAYEMSDQKLIEQVLSEYQEIV